MSLALTLGLGTAALAQSGGAAEEQYAGQTTTAPVSASGSAPTAVTPSGTTTPSTADDDASDDSGSGSGSGSGGGGKDDSGAVQGAGDSGRDGDGSGSGGGTTSTSGAGSATPSSAPSCEPRVTYIHFGIAPADTRDGVLHGVERAGMQTRYEGPMTRARMQAFLASPLAKRFSADGPRAVGRALGAQLVDPTALSHRAFPRLFGTKAFHDRVPEDLNVLRVVLTRRDDLGADEVAFMEGVAAGLVSTGIPVVYAEHRDQEPSHVREFADLGVSTVSDVDTKAGQLRLAKLVYGACTPDGVRAVPASQVRLKPASAVIEGTDGGGSMALAIFAGLLGVAGLGAAGAVRRRRLQR